MPAGDLQVGIRTPAETVLTDPEAARSVELSTIDSVSPSLAELLRLCPLRAGLSRVRNADDVVLGNPKAWLGTSYHEVLAAPAGSTPEKVWERAIDRQQLRALAHPLNKRFGAAERWPGYHLVKAMALVRAPERLSGQADGQRLKARGAEHGGGSGSETWLTGANGRIVGRPDLLRGDTLVDFKTGNVYDEGDGDLVKASFVRQLQMYAFLVKERSGHWPARGILLPMEGPPVEVALEPGECQSTVEEALGRLDWFNSQVAAAASVESLATPSAEACKWCPYQLLCHAFWAAIDGSWSARLGGAVVAGAAAGAPQPIHGGLAYSLSIAATEGTEVGELVALAPLKPEIHSALAAITSGSGVRVVGLAKRHDGSVLPGIRTVVARTADLPEIRVG